MKMKRRMGRNNGNNIEGGEHLEGTMVVHEHLPHLV